MIYSEADLNPVQNYMTEFTTPEIDKWENISDTQKKINTTATLSLLLLAIFDMASSVPEFL